MKKGFTIIEIIISISIMLMVGISTTFFILNKNNNELEQIKNEVVDAVNLYINTEYDEDGILYINGIKSSRRGLYLTVNNLLEKGYLEDNLVKTLEKNTNLDANDLKILASNSVYDNENEVCSEGLIKFEFNFDEFDNGPIYLCPTNSKIGDFYTDNVFNYIVKYISYIGQMQMSTNLKEDLMSNDDLNKYYYKVFQSFGVEEGHEFFIYKPKNQGLKSRIDDGDTIYYYRGKDVNNYVSFSNVFYNDCRFRIVSLTDDYIKIIPSNTDGSSCFFGYSGNANKTIYYNDMIDKEYIFNVSIKLDNKLTLEEKSQYFYNLDFCKNYICSEYYSDYIGILTYEEAIYSGYSGALLLGRIYRGYIDESYLQSGYGSIFALPKNAFPSPPGYYGYFGELSDGYKPSISPVRYIDSMYYRDNTLEYDDDGYLRPVIALNINMWEIKGNGTIDNPFVLKAKAI